MPGSGGLGTGNVNIVTVKSRVAPRPRIPAACYQFRRVVDIIWLAAPVWRLVVVTQQTIRNAVAAGWPASGKGTRPCAVRRAPHILTLVILYRAFLATAQRPQRGRRALAGRAAARLLPR